MLWGRGKSVTAADRREAASGTGVCARSSQLRQWGAADGLDVESSATRPGRCCHNNAEDAGTERDAKDGPDMPFTERAYFPAGAAAAGSGSFPAFQFRGRHEGPDWRRLSAVDVGRVWREGDVAALQEHLEHVTFCSAERERCPHCQGPADPLLLKLLRLAQLCTEYLLHSQEYLSAQLSSLEEALRAAQAQRDRLAEEVAQRAQEVKGLKEECRRRKKMISTQQMMLEARASYHQCQFCEKAFMNYSFLQGHMLRRHPEECQIAEQKRKAKTDKLQDEIEKLKEQLQLTKSQLEAEQQANMVRFSKECEQQKSKEEEILQSFHKWKEEEKAKLADEIEKVKDMFMKELKELSSRNSTLENQLLTLQTSSMQKSNLGTLKDSHEFMEEKPQSTQDYHKVVKLLEKQESKWTSRIQALRQDHETEKSLLLSQIEKLKSSVREDLNKNNTFYKRRIEELGERLQEQNDLIITQKKQIKELSTKSVASIKPSHTNAAVEHLEESKSSLPVMYEQAPLVHMLEPIEELSEEEKEIEKDELKTGRSNQHLINALKTDPSLTKELRVVLEQALEEKLESLGIKAGVRGIPNDRLNKILRAIESAREHKLKQEPDIQRIREYLERQVSFRVVEKSTLSNRTVSSPYIPSEGKQKFNQLGISSSTIPQKPVKRSLTAVRPAEQRAENTSTPKTPPFSSEEEADEDDVKQLHVSRELLQKQSKTSSNKVSAFQMASDKSDLDGTEESETEETGTPVKTSKGAVIQKLTEQVGKSLSNHGNKSRPAGGIDVAQAFIKKEEVQEPKFTEVDEDDWDISSIEEDYLLMKDNSGQKGSTAQKNESNAASVVHAWGLPKKTVPKQEGPREADNTSTLKSSLVTVTDWSDSSDI
ncbi:cilium assembly protein DZIP1 isoform X3 [Tympanuchus pallidicinctus]|uniref:cilium assembly protein DZIP1 isoform X3 n=1 Tax=Tympanuchus pallidicinctus TaxID=109042 RepID=UPI0022875AD2|nr:cilium assembly protein DZIP1 isoform X3 [Tympanuchus pallidicinctus]